MTELAPPARRVSALLAVVALAVTACAEQSPQEPEGSDDVTPSEDPLASFYNQSVEWEDCEDLDEDLRCGTITVPVDYQEPQGETLEIAVAAHGEAEDPHLLFNPGGPGLSGVDTIAGQLETVATEELLEGYTVVGFDPRGVHRSEGIRCLTDREFDQFRQPPEGTSLPGAVDEEAAFAAAAESAERVAQSCQSRHGHVLGHVDTLSAAQDMDVLRAALGEDELHYVGFSYGTQLGVTYAEEFPQHVGRFVLDAMIDVSLEADELALEQAEAIENGLHSFAEWCLDGRCPVTGEPHDVVEAVAGLLDELAQEPRTGDDGRLVDDFTVLSGILTTMYSPQAWPLLREGLDAALTADDFTAFQYLSDLREGRNPDGSYDWISTFAFQAIRCLDYPTADTHEQVEAEAEELADASPTFSSVWSYAALFCDALPHEATGEPWRPSEDLPQMLFLGTTGDPITPVSWAENMHAMIPTSSLLIYEGEGHVAYRPGADCVTEAVDEFLLSGELFEGRQDC